MFYTVCSYFASSFFFKKLWSQQVRALGYAHWHVLCVCMSDVNSAFHHVLRVTIEQKEGKVNDGHQDFAYMQVNGDTVRLARIVVAVCNDKVCRNGIRLIFSPLTW